MKTIILSIFLLLTAQFSIAQELQSSDCSVENLKCIKTKIERNEISPDFLARQNGFGKTSLHIAVEAKDLDLVKMLLYNNSSLSSIADNSGNLPIHRAVQLNQLPILETILNTHQDDINKLDRNEESILDIANANGFSELARYIEQRGGRVGKVKSNKTTLFLYGLYILISIAITIWVAQTLFKNGRVFLLDAFHNTELADSVNHLLVVGFYLINLGYITIALKIGHKPIDVVEAFEILSFKLGLVILILGFMHFFNLYLFGRLRKRTLLKKELGLDKNLDVVRPTS